MEIATPYTRESFNVSHVDLSLRMIANQAPRLDIKNVFTEGLIKIQTTLNNRYYVLATTLAQNLSSVFSIGIEDGPQIKPENGQAVGQEHTSPSKHAAFDIRERRKLAKRIIKAIQPQLELAVRAEADITKKSADTMVHDLEVLLDACLHSRQEAAPDGMATHGTPDEMVVESTAHGGSGPNELSGSNGAHETSEVNVHGDDMDVDLCDEDAPGEQVDDAELFPAISIAAENGSSKPTNGNSHQEPEETTGQSKSRYPGNGLKSSDTPPDTNGYSSALEHHQPPPPTPPVSSGGANSTSGQENTGSDSATSLTEGGIPWYLKSFDPVGTTILEVQWTGRDIVRGMSEELTDIDDDELKGMGADMEGIENIPEEVMGEGKIETVLRTRKGKAKKRWRGYR
jgi:NuA3 HAT complex component NTO1